MFKSYHRGSSVYQDLNKDILLREIWLSLRLLYQYNLTQLPVTHLIPCPLLAFVYTIISRESLNPNSDIFFSKSFANISKLRLIFTSGMNFYLIIPLQLLCLKSYLISIFLSKSKRSNNISKLKIKKNLVLFSALSFVSSGIYLCMIQITLSDFLLIHQFQTLDFLLHMTQYSHHKFWLN